MKKIILLLFIPLISFGQNLDAYKYIYVPDINYENSTKDTYGLSAEIRKTFRNNRFLVIKDDQLKDYLTKNNPCELIKVSKLFHRSEGRYRQSVNFEIINCLNKVIYSGSAKAGSDMTSASRDIRTAGARIVNKALNNYKFNSSLTPNLPERKFNFSNSKFNFDINSEASIRKYFDDNTADLIEGIWGYHDNTNLKYKLLILKEDFKFKLIILESNNSLWNKGDLKGELETAAVDELMTVKWTMGNKVDVLETIATVKNNAIIELTLTGAKVELYKIYPKINPQKKARNINSVDGWSSNGSGIIISESGHIVTNHHVIDDADDIEVEFIIDGEVQKFNAVIIQSDKVNDLAIIKIVDVNFDGFKELPYNFKTRSSDVGTKIYTFGYPKALSGMGKEIKVTEGIISSKSGIMGDITTYQITAPIQGGNSGGPLFDDKGNFIGINSSKFNSDETENVNYSIKSSYVMSLIDVLPKSIDLPSSTKLQSLTLTEQIKEISKYVVLVKVK